MTPGYLKAVARPVRRTRWRWGALLVGTLCGVLWLGRGLSAYLAQSFPEGGAQATADQRWQLRRLADAALLWAHAASWECPDRAVLFRVTDRRDDLDMWGRELLYACRRTDAAVDVLLSSSGPDRRLGTSDDVVVGAHVERAAQVQP